MAKIGWIGLGNMGAPMSTNLVKAGNEVIVWNRTKSKAQPVLDAGAAWADSPKEIGEKCDIVFTMVADGPTLLKVAVGDDGALAGMSDGKILVDMSTVSAEESATVAEAAKAKGVELVRAPVTGSTALAANASLGILASGDKATYEKVLPYFEKMGKNQFYLGSGEQARIMKLCLNLMIASTMQMEAEAVVLAEKAGSETRQACDIIAGSAAGSPLTGYKAALIAGGEYAPAFSVKLMMKDLDLALAAGKQYGVPLPSTALTRQSLQSAAATGRAEKDFSVLTQCLEEQSGYKRP